MSTSHTPRIDAGVLTVGVHIAIVEAYSMCMTGIISHRCGGPVSPTRDHIGERMSAVLKPV